jgi:hypothetical protein
MSLNDGYEIIEKLLLHNEKLKELLNVLEIVVYDFDGKQRIFNRAAVGEHHLSFIDKSSLLLEYGRIIINENNKMFDELFRITRQTNLIINL